MAPSARKLTFKMIVADDGFEAKLFFINPTKKALFYLKSQINGTNVSMLIDTRVTKSFRTPTHTKRLKIGMENKALPVKVNFTQGSYRPAHVAREYISRRVWRNLKKIFPFVS